MPSQGDANPHFVRPFQPQGPDQYPQTPPVGPFLQQPQHQGQHSGPLSLSPGRTEQHRPEPPPDVKPARHHGSKQSGKNSRPLGPLVSFHPHFQDQHPHSQPNHPGQQTEPLVPLGPIANMIMKTHNLLQSVKASKPCCWSHWCQCQGMTMKTNCIHDTQGQPQHGQRTHPNGLLRPHPQQTNLFQWTPKFDVSTATLNAAYLDMGYLLNADVTVLANFTHPNKQVSVHFSSLIIDLYYGNTLIATQYIEPFSAHKRESMFANVHMVVSQVRLGLLESQRLQKQMEINRAVFESRDLSEHVLILEISYGTLIGYMVTAKLCSPDLLMGFWLVGNARQNTKEAFGFSSTCRLCFEH